MSLWLLIRRSLVFHRRMHVAVFLGVVVAGAVLTGALAIGDSMRGSLRELVVERLGLIDQAMVAPRFFRSELAGEFAKQTGAKAQAGIFMQAALTRATNDAKPRTFRAGKVQVVGVEPNFFELWPARQRPGQPLPERGVFLNRATAEELGLDERGLIADSGDSPEIVLRLPQQSEIPPDSPLGKKKETSLSIRLAVAGILPDEGPGRFGLFPSQQIPKVAYVPLGVLQGLLEQPDRANLLLVAGDDAAQSVALDRENALAADLAPKLADYGLTLKKLDADVWQLTSDTLLLNEAIVTEIRIWSKLGDRRLRENFVYLANWIAAGPKARIPYSTVAALDFAAPPPFGPWLDVDGKPIPALGEDDIVLNQWAVDDLRQQGQDVQVGAPITLTFFEPESTHGETAERRAKFTLRAIVPLSGPALDRELTPELKGITDRDSIANWDPPFPYDPGRVRSVKPNDQDEAYWDEYKTTPKAYVSDATGRNIWKSRFGTATGLRFTGKPGDTAESLEKQLAGIMPAEELGFALLPVKRMGLDAASGTTPFDGLFLGFSMFLIAAALLLIGLLFKLGLERRARELGIELAHGFTRARLRTRYLLEGGCVALVGSMIGAAVGIGFAALMIHGLRTWWLAAIVTPFLELHVLPRTLAVGTALTLIVALGTMLWTLRSLKKVGARNLLAGRAELPFDASTKKRSWTTGIVAGCAFVAGALIILGTRLSGEGQAGAFFGSGALLLIAATTGIRAGFRYSAAHGSNAVQGLWSLAWSNAARAPGRSVLTLGLMAMAVFLITAISAFHLTPPPDGREKDRGDGGFAIMAESDLPIYQNLSDATDRADLGFDDEQEKIAAAATIIPLRVQRGEDASCLNLYQSTQPRVLSVNDKFIARGGFEWAAFDRKFPDDPWRALATSTNSDVYPVVLDFNTAMYSLHLYNGLGQTFEIGDGHGGTIRMVVAGLLKNSIFQGDLLLSEANFRKLYPTVNGARMFLIAPGLKDDVAATEQAFENALSDYGFTAERTRDRLAALMAVQNTYLSTFQSLGALGLILGTFGLAIVQLRNVWERRGELALMQALGFRRRRLGMLLLDESLTLMLAGLGLGVATALVAISPKLIGGDAGVPWLALAVVLGIVVATGVSAGAWATRVALRAPVVETLREDG